MMEWLAGLLGEIAGDPGHRTVVVYVPGAPADLRLLAEMRLLKAAYDPRTHRIVVVLPPAVSPMAVPAEATVRRIAFGDVDVVEAVVPAAVRAAGRSGAMGGAVQVAGVAVMLVLGPRLDGDGGDGILLRAGARAVIDTGDFPPLPLADDDRARAAASIRALGIDAADPVVALLSESVDAAWEPALRFLLAEGYWVIRLAAPAAPPPAFAHPRFLDRPFCGADGGYGAVGAVAGAAFVLRRPSHPFDLAVAFATPSLAVDLPPWFPLPLPGEIIVPRLVCERTSGRPLSYREIAAAGLMAPVREDDLARRGLRFADTDPEVILQAAVEMDRRRRGVFAPNPFAVLRHEKYRLINRLLDDTVRRQAEEDGMGAGHFGPAVGAVLAEGFVTRHPGFLAGDVSAFTVPGREARAVGVNDLAAYERDILAARQAGPPIDTRHGRRAVVLSPEVATAYFLLGDLGGDPGGDRGAGSDPAAARVAYRRACTLRPLVRWRTAPPPAAFRALVLMAPGAGNTPFRDLFSDAPCDVHLLMLAPGVETDAGRFGVHADLVVNLVSDTDTSQDVLPLAAALIGRLGRPVINHPAVIAHTDRAAVAARLTGIAHCRVPRIVRFTGAPPPGFAPPFLIRLAGRHGGEEFEPVADPAALAAFTARHPGAAFYAIEPIDYRSADGYFRKYRVILIDGAVYPYHLAIGSSWKVHHYSTDMAHHPWMQAEEKAFLDHPDGVFTPAHAGAFAAIHAAIGLEYFGIDCAIAGNGDLVLFEVNATMLVHTDNAAFPYKAPAVARIKAAFTAMLERRAAAG